jgi:hypothetical protein
LLDTSRRWNRQHTGRRLCHGPFPLARAPVGLGRARRRSITGWRSRQGRCTSTDLESLVMLRKRACHMQDQGGERRCPPSVKSLLSHRLPARQSRPAPRPCPGFPAEIRFHCACHVFTLIYQGVPLHIRKLPSLSTPMTHGWCELQDFFAFLALRSSTLWPWGEKRMSRLGFRLKAEPRGDDVLPPFTTLPPPRDFDVPACDVFWCLPALRAWHR